MELEAHNLHFFFCEALIEAYNVLCNPVARIDKMKLSDLEHFETVINDRLSNNTYCQKQLLILGIKTNVVPLQTLRKVFRPGYLNKTHNLRRKQEETLSKLAVFLALKGWSHFVDTVNQKYGIYDNVNIQPNDSRMVFEVTLKAMHAEFNALKTVPHIDTNQLDNYFIKEGAEYKRILEMLERRKLLGLTISRPSNASSYSIFSMVIISASPKQVIVAVTKDISLFWESVQPTEVRVMEGGITWHKYRLIKQNETWRIIDCKVSSMYDVTNSR